MAYWLHCDYENKRIKESRTSWEYTKQKDGKKRANISNLREGDKVIFVKDLQAYADGVIDSINLKYNKIRPYKVDYENIIIWKRKIDLGSREVKHFLANVP